MAYSPESLPQLAELPEYLFRELLRISIEINRIEEGRFLEVRALPPGKPRDGMLAIADGVDWDPGAGKGLYEYKDGSWSKC